MATSLGDDVEAVVKALQKNGIPRQAAKEATEIAKQRGSFSIFSLVDALTPLATTIQYAGDRTDADAKASALLALAL